MEFPAARVIDAVRGASISIHTILIFAWACGPRLDKHTILSHPPLVPRQTRQARSLERARRPAWLSTERADPREALSFVGRGRGASLKVAQARARKDFDRQIAGFVGLKVRSSFSAEERYSNDGGKEKRSIDVRSERQAHLQALLKIVPQQTYWEEIARPERRTIQAYAFAQVPKKTLQGVRSAARLQRALKGRRLLVVRFGKSSLERAMEGEVISALLSSAHVLPARSAGALEASLWLEGFVKTKNKRLELGVHIKRTCPEGALRAAPFLGRGCAL